MNPSSNQRAEKLLRSQVSAYRWREFKATGWLRVKGPSGRTWKIFRSGTVEGRCIVWDCRALQCGRGGTCPCEHIPNWDRVLAVKLMIECDEDLFLRTALI